MTWWEESGVEDFIRNIAIKRLSRMYQEMNPGQGISSSDINHKVFSMHQEFKQGNYTNVCLYLVEVANEIWYSKHQTQEIDNIIEDLKIKTYVENDGIGAYEFWGNKGFDHGTNYLSIDECQDLELTIIFKTQLNEDLETYIKEEILENLDTTRHVTIENRLTEETELETDFKLVPIMNLKNPKTFTTIVNITSSSPIKHIVSCTLTWSDEC